MQIDQQSGRPRHRVGAGTPRRQGRQERELWHRLERDAGGKKWVGTREGSQSRCRPRGPRVAAGRLARAQGFLPLFLMVVVVVDDVVVGGMVVVVVVVVVVDVVVVADEVVVVVVVEPLCCAMTA